MDNMIELTTFNSSSENDDDIAKVNDQKDVENPKKTVEEAKKDGEAAKQDGDKASKVQIPPQNKEVKEAVDNYADNGAVSADENDPPVIKKILGLYVNVKKLGINKYTRDNVKTVAKALYNFVNIYNQVGSPSRLNKGSALKHKGDPAFAKERYEKYQELYTELVNASKAYETFMPGNDVVFDDIMEEYKSIIEGDELAGVFMTQKKYMESLVGTMPPQEEKKAREEAYEKLNIMKDDYVSKKVELPTEEEVNQQIEETKKSNGDPTALLKQLFILRDSNIVLGTMKNSFGIQETNSNMLLSIKEAFRTMSSQKRIEIIKMLVRVSKEADLRVIKEYQAVLAVESDNKDLSHEKQKKRAAYKVQNGATYRMRRIINDSLRFLSGGISEFEASQIKSNEAFLDSVTMGELGGSEDVVDEKENKIFKDKDSDNQNNNNNEYKGIGGNNSIEENDNKKNGISESKDTDNSKNKVNEINKNKDNSEKNDTENTEIKDKGITENKDNKNQENLIKGNKEQKKTDNPEKKKLTDNKEETAEKEAQKAKEEKEKKKAQYSDIIKDIDVSLHGDKDITLEEKKKLTEEVGFASPHGTLLIASLGDRLQFTYKKGNGKLHDKLIENETSLKKNSIIKNNTSAQIGETIKLYKEYIGDDYKGKMSELIKTYMKLEDELEISVKNNVSPDELFNIWNTHIMDIKSYIKLIISGTVVVRNDMDEITAVVEKSKELLGNKVFHELFYDGLNEIKEILKSVEAEKKKKYPEPENLDRSMDLKRAERDCVEAMELMEKTETTIYEEGSALITERSKLLKMAQSVVHKKLDTLSKQKSPALRAYYNILSVRRRGKDVDKESKTKLDQIVEQATRALDNLEGTANTVWIDELQELYVQANAVVESYRKKQEEEKKKREEEEKERIRKQKEEEEAARLKKEQEELKKKEELKTKEDDNKKNLKDEKKVIEDSKKEISENDKEDNPKEGKGSDNKNNDQANGKDTTGSGAPSDGSVSSGGTK